MVEHAAMVVFLSARNVSLVGIARVVEAGIVRLPRDAGGAGLLDGVRQQLARGGLDNVQRALLRSAGGGPVGNVLAVVRSLPPVQRDGAVGGQGIDVHQSAVRALQSLANVEHWLVLHAFAPGVEVALAPDLGRAYVADAQQLREPGMQSSRGPAAGPAGCACTPVDARTYSCVSGLSPFSIQR